MFSYVSDLIDEPPTSTISNNSFNNSVAVNNGSITITGLPKTLDGFEDYKLRSRLMTLSFDELELAIKFIDFLKSSGYEVKKK